MKRFWSSLRGRLGPLGWGALIVFCISRCADFINLFTKLYLGRKLTAVDFGAVEPAFSVMWLAAIPTAVLGNVGSKSISRLRAMGDEEGCRSVIVDMLRGTVAATVLVVAGLLMSRDFLLSRLSLKEESFFWIITGMCIAGLWNPLCVQIARGGRRYGLLLFPDVMNPLVTLVLTLLLVAALPNKLEGALLARTLGMGLATAAMVMVLGREIRKPRRRSREEITIMKETIVPMLCFLATAAVLMHFDRLFVRNFLTIYSGGFGAVVTLGMIPGMMIAPIAFVAYPIVAGEHAAGRGLKRFTQQATVLGAVITACFVAVFAVVGKRLFGYWDEAFLPYARYLWMYALVMGLHGIIMTIASMEIARHRYGCIKFMMAPTLAMCVGLYVLASHVELGHVIGAGLLTRVLMLAAIVGYVWMQDGRRESASGSVT